MDHQLILDRYRPLAVIGEGGHGDVTLAFDTRLARRVAIKSIPLPREQASPTGLEEARTAAMLSHPAVVVVHEWDTDTEHAHIVSEFVDGADLGAILDAFGPLSLDAGAAVLEPLADALDFAHENGVLHLDVKPENVIVDRSGTVKLGDFGIATLTSGDMTATAQAGTLGFMPPEQLRGEEVDDRTDQWALAALAFETLADANPYSADTLEGAIFRAVDVEPAAPTEFEPSLPPALDDILLAATDPDPDQRYRDVGDLALALLGQLGDADRGREELAAMVSDLAGEEESFDEEPLGIWDRLAQHASAARRVLAAVLCGWLAWAGIGALSLGVAPTIAAALFVAVAGAAAPGLGLALGLLAFGIGLFVEGAVPGIVFLVAATAFWITLGRHGRFPAFAPVAAPALGMGPFGLTIPLLLGFGASPLTAALAAAWSAVSLQVASALSGNPAPYLDVGLGLLKSSSAGTAQLDAVADLATQPGVWIVVVAWSLAAAVGSVFARGGTRGGATAGIVLASMVLLGAYGVWGLFDPSVRVDTGPLLVHTAGSLILMTVIVAMGAPTRSEAE